MWMRGCQSWWVWGVRGCVAALFGLLELLYPAPTVHLAVMLYGAFIKLDSLLSIIIAAYWLRTPAAPPLIAAGVVGLLSGIFALVRAGADPSVLTATLGLAAFVRGAFELLYASRARSLVHNLRPAQVAGVLISGYGVVILLGRLIGLYPLVKAFAVYATVAGGCYFYTAMRLRNLERELTAAGSEPQVG